MVIPVIGTVACFIILMVILWRVFQCVHAWELVDKTEMSSGFENMAKAGVSTGFCSPFDYPKLAARTIILALRCPKCGAAKIFREKSIG